MQEDSGCLWALAPQGAPLAPREKEVQVFKKCVGWDWELVITSRCRTAHGPCSDLMADLHNAQKMDNSKVGFMNLENWQGVVWCWGPSRLKSCRFGSYF